MSSGLSNQFSNLFKSQDSKFFIKTAILITSVPLLTLSLIIYSLYLYIDMNYAFYLSLGYSNDPQLRSAFFDQIMLSLLDFFPWIALFLCSVFFLGLLISHLILKPFKLVAMMCKEYAKNKNAVFVFDTLNRQKLIIRCGYLLIDFCKHRDQGNKGEFVMPASLKKITSPVPDYVFYMQYFAFMLILNGITIVSTFFCIQQIQQSIITNAITLFKMDNKVTLYLSNQQDSTNTIFMACIVFSIVLYTLLSKKIITDIEGVSFGYLRDIRHIVSGNFNIRLAARSKDPGKDTIKEVNKLLNATLA